MTDNLRESVSALLDDEVSEIEVHRILRNLEKDPKIKSSFINFQQIRAVIRRDGMLSNQDHLTLHKLIGEAIHQEPAISDSMNMAGGFRLTGWNASRYTKPVAGFAIAASLVLAVFVGFQVQTGLDQGHGLVSEPGDLVEPNGRNPTMVNSTNVNSTNVNSNRVKPDFTQPVLTDYAVGNLSDNSSSLEDPQDDLVELDAEKQKLIRKYLRRHDRMTRLNSDVKVVTFDNPDAN